MTQRNDHKTAKPRIIRVGVVLFYLALATAIAWLAAARWNGTPALDPATSALGMPPGPPLAAERDRTKELFAALNSLPPLPPISVPPAPTGKQWNTSNWTRVVVSDALGGSWTPEARPNLQAVIGYVRSPAVEDVLRSLANIQPGGWRPYGPDGDGSLGMSPVRRAVKILTARARYFHAGDHNTEAAITDLGTIFRVSDTVYDSGSVIGVLVALACDALAVEEFRLLVYENELTPQQASLAMSTVRSNTMDYDAIWATTADAQIYELQWALDCTYTDDGNGDGWLVLSTFGKFTGSNPAAFPRSGAWNVLSPLFNSRKRLTQRIAQYEEEYDRIGSLSFAGAQTSLHQLQTHAALNIADGPLAIAFGGGWFSRIHFLITRHAAKRRALLIAIALSAYRHDHGTYPDSLDDLVGPYIENIPTGPLDGERPRYVRRGDDDYLLYAIGPNLIDDGGIENPGYSGLLNGGDLIFTTPRGEPIFEPTLETIEP